MTSSIARTCADCGTLNRLTIMTSGVTPAWRIACSHCGETIVTPPNVRRQAPGAEVIPLPVPFMRPGATLPARRNANLPARRRESTALATLRPLRERVAGGASTGVSFLAACGFAVAALTFEPAPDAALDAPAALPTGPEAPFDGGAVAGDSALAVMSDERAAADLPPRLSQPAPLAQPQLAAVADEQPLALAADRPQPDDAGRGSAALLRLAAAEALGGRDQAYPDPMEGMMAVQMAGLTDPEEAEAGLALSKDARREVQRRLSLARHDPRGVDGVFGPATRAAIAAWQEKAGLPATGYMDQRAFAMLAEQTDADYRAWAAAEKTRKPAERQFASLESWPAATGRGDGCRRAGSGEIAYGQNVKCDIKGFRESFVTLKSDLAQLLDGGGKASSRGLARRGPGDA